MATIAVGPGATDRAGVVSNASYTYIDLNGPSDGSGDLKAVDCYLVANATGIKFGTFYRHATSNTYYYCRDSAVIAPMAGGAKRTATTDSGGTALAIKVCMGDYLGIFTVLSQIERDATGYSSFMYLNADACNSGDLADYAEAAGDAISIFASGATPAAGGAWTQMAKACGQSFDLIYSMPGITKDATSKVVGIAV